MFPYQPSLPRKIVSFGKHFLSISLNCISNEYTASAKNRHISSEVAHTADTFIMFLDIIVSFVLFYCCITSDSNRIVHAQNVQCFASASKMVALGIVPENPIGMPRKSILNPYVRAFVSKERETVFHMWKYSGSICFIVIGEKLFLVLYISLPNFWIFL